MTPLVDTDSILPSFEDICKLQCNTIRHIPAKFRPAFTLILSSNFRLDFSVNDGISWLKLFLLPKCIPVSSKRRGHHHKPSSIEHPCNLWSQGRFDALWEHTTSQVTLRDHHPRQCIPRQSIITAIFLANFVVLKVDMRNAFNLVSHQAVLDEVVCTFQSCSPGQHGAMVCTQCYGTQWELLVQRLVCNKGTP